MYSSKQKQAFSMILEGLEADLSAQAPARPVSLDSSSEEWTLEHNEGKLAIDVAQNETHIFVVSAMAGANPERIEGYVHNDLLTIRGFRTNPIEEMDGGVEFFCRECFWGVFSRTIVLPTDVHGDMALAKYQSGILLVTIPKRNTDRKISIEIVEE